MRTLPVSVCLWLGLVVFPAPSAATFSIVVCDPVTRTCACAVATNNLAVGAAVCAVRAGAGALVSQFETNPMYGRVGLDLLASGLSPEDVLERLLAGDGNFEGRGIEARQVAVVGLVAQSAVHTGSDVLASPWAGARRGPYYSIQGNGLASESVVQAMEAAYLAAEGTLAERLMAALRAGYAAGGQTTGALSAALQVRTEAGWPVDVDLRVDASADPVADLQRLVEWHYAHLAMLRAERAARGGMSEEAWTSVAEALHRGAGWDRIWRRAARLAVQLDEPGRALDYLGVFKALNPVWARGEITDTLYRPLEGNRLFEAWRKESGAGEYTEQGK